MDSNILTALIGLATGAVGCWFTTFWMKPILKYRELRSQVFADLISYAQVVNSEGLNESMQRLLEERVLANRRSSAELAACAAELPFWQLRGRSPAGASGHLIGFSNERNGDAAACSARR